jgi:hypothetical protein
VAKIGISSLAFLFLIGHPAIAQMVAFGVAGGVRATGDVSGAVTPESKRYIVGPKLEVRLPLHLSFELDALYRTVGFTGYSVPPFGYSILRERDNSWEFPAIVKYHLPGIARLHPFMGLGYSPRVVYGNAAESGAFVNQVTGASTSYSITPNRSTSVAQGLVVAGGLELGAHHVLISPELRYVHWSAPAIGVTNAAAPYTFAAPQDELFVLVGIAWRKWPPGS